MARKSNRTCITCGKEYEYCNTCSGDRNKEAWHSIYCSENCKNVFSAVSDYLAGENTKEEAKEKLAKCDLRNKSNFKAKIVETIDEINKVVPTFVKKEKVEIEPKVEPKEEN